MADSFFVGYHEKAPAPVRRVFRVLIPVVAGLLLLVAAMLAGAQQFDAARFEFGKISSHAGLLRSAPVPHLLTEDGSIVLLVGRGKHGAVLASQDGARIQIEGTRVLRGATVMLEIIPESEVLIAPPSPQPVAIRLGDVTLSGEIVGSKCFLGVMNPAHGTVHRACARHCILGGVPAMLDTQSGAEPVLLTGWDPSRVAQNVGVPVQIRGTRWRLPGIEWVEISTIDRGSAPDHTLVP